MANPILILADEAAKEQTLAEYVSHKYLNSIFGEEKQAPVIPQTLSVMQKLKKQLGLDIDTQRYTLNPREIQKIAFDLVTTSSFETTILDNSCIDKLEIVAGGENAQQYLLEHVFVDIKTAFFIASLAQADTITPMQALRGYVFASSVAINQVGKALIANGYEHISLAKNAPFNLKTPKAMKTYGRIGIPVGLASIASPLIFAAAERLSEQRREQQEKKDLEAKQPSDELAS